MSDVIFGDQLQTAIAFLLYMFVFGWIGWRRGAMRELIVFITALLTLIIVRTQGDILISMANLAWRLFIAIAGGALSSGDDGGGISLSDTSNLIIPCPSADAAVTCNSIGFLFLFWVSIVILAYLFTSLFIKSSESNGWAILIGIMNGFLYASVFLPRLVSLIDPNAIVLDQPIMIETLFTLLDAAWTSISNVASMIWSSLGSLQPYVLLLLLILLVVGAASTLRTQKSS